jgi:hypothetical protein
MELPVMLLRHARWLVAGIAALAGIGLSPARSNADVTILVEELNASSTVVASQSQTLSGSGSLNFSGVYFTGLAVVNTNSTSSSSVASLIPAFGGQLTNAFDVAQNHMLRVTVSDNTFQPSGPNGTLKVQVSGSTGFASGTESIVEDTRVYNPATNGTVLLVPNLISSDGSLQQKSVATQGLTSPYAIEQTLTISFSGAIPQNATFGSTGGASLSSSAVPAPGGLALALIGLPLIGLRRALRKRAAA